MNNKDTFENFENGILKLFFYIKIFYCTTPHKIHLPSHDQLYLF